jgi:hypothetical protein
MKLKLAALAAFILTLFAAGAQTPTAAELVQKGLFNQRTKGDADGAIANFRQAIATAGADRATAARAQTMLVAAYLSKGDVVAAAREFSFLTTAYADQKDAITSVTMALQMAPEIRAGLPTPSASPRLGELQNGVYRHTASGTEIRLPAGWSVEMDSVSSGGGESVDLSSGQKSLFIWMKSRAAQVAEIPGFLDMDVDSKLHARKFDGENETYQILPGSRTMAGAGARQSETVAFDFVQQGKPQIEYGTFILTTKTLVYFRSYGDPSELPDIARIHSAFDASTTIP